MTDPAPDVLDTVAFRNLIATSRVVFLDQGDALLKQGAATDAAYFLASGEVAVIAETAYGAVRLATITAPRLIGEVGVFADLPRTASIVAEGPITAHRIERHRILEFGQNNPVFLRSIIAQLGRQLDCVNRTIGLYTNALSGLEKQEFDPLLLDDLRNPPAQLAEFATVFRRFAGEIQSKRRQEAELASAAVIQQSFLPRREILTQVADRLDVAASIRAARQVGGDFYDYLRLPGDKFAFAVGDICGKGMPAALFTANVVTILRASARKENTVAKVLARANKLICRDNPASLFATVFFGVIELATGHMYYGNCGHNAPVVVRADGSILKLPATGLPLGLFDDKSAKEADLILDPGDLLFAFSDGITEAHDSGKREFGEERLTHRLLRSLGQPAEAIVAGIIEDVDAFAGTAEQADDITGLALSRPST